MRQRARAQLLASCAAGCLQLLGGCSGGSSSSAPPGPSLTITRVGWVEENIDPSYWSTPPTNGETAFYDFWVHYDGDIAFTDIAYARVYLPAGSYWSVAKQADWLDPVNRVIGGWHRLYSSQPNTLPIGALQVEVKLTDGVDAKYTAYVPAPGSTTAGSYATMHSEEVAFPLANSAPMIKRAALGPTQTLTAASQTIAVTFSVADPNVYDGFVWFYDGSGKYVAGFFYLVDPATGLATPRLDGSTFHTDGTLNTLTVYPSDLTFETGATFDQIARFRVVLTDGAQYVARGTGKLAYDCRSISAGAWLTVQ
jgi:hypothetical protein